MAMSFGGISKSKVATIIVAIDGTGDTIDIQTGINLLSAAGGVVYIKEGTYSVSDLKIIGDNISLFGAGPATIILDTTSTFQVLTITGDNVTVKDISFLGLGAANSVIAILSGNNDNIIIENCLFDNFGESVIFIGGTSNNIILSNNRIIDCDEQGILVSVGIGTLSNILVSNNIIENIGKTGIQVAATGATGITEKIILANNIIVNADSENSNTYSGIYFTSAAGGDVHNCTIIGNSVSDCDDWGINIDSADVVNTLITGNNVFDNTSGGINNGGTGTEIGHNITA